jgi:hypothetical protein
LARYSKYSLLWGGGEEMCFICDRAVVLMA